jgi:hypothetical protein
MEGVMSIRLAIVFCSVAAAGALAAAFDLSGVAHAITETNFRYSTPHTGYITIDPGAVSPGASTISNYTFSNLGGLHYAGAGTACFTTGVNFPDHATLNAMTAWYASAANGNPDFSVTRRTLSNNNTIAVATGVGFDDSGSQKVITTGAASAVAIVNNRAYSYVLIACLTNGDSFFGARIKYTYTTAGD